jgi:DNA-binding CsgD family transcriptional regulator
MQLDQLNSTELASMLGRLDPLVMAVDAEGTILDRHICNNERVPLDMLDARSLRAVLSTEVCSEWLRMIRLAAVERSVASAIVILDGRGHEAVCSPYTVDHGGLKLEAALLSLLPTALCANAYVVQPTGTRLLLKAHEWGPLETLSRCQLDTLRNVTMGLSNDEIAKKICRTKRAVEWHIRYLNQQLGISGRERLAMIGRDAGLYCFSGCEWSSLLKTRPARRPGVDPAEPDVTAQPIAA